MTQLPGEADDNPLPTGRIRGMDLARVGWAVIRRRWRALLPAAVTMSGISAVVQCALAIWVYGSLEAAARGKFALDGGIAAWLQDPTKGAPPNLSSSVIAIVIGSLILPTVVTVAAALVVRDVGSGRDDSAGGYLNRAVAATPRAIVTTTLGTLVSAAPAAVTLLLAWQLRGNTTTVTTTQGPVSVPVFSVGVLLVLGLPSLAWLVYATARLGLALQVMVADAAAPVAAVRTTWAVTRRQAARVLGITLLTAVTAASIGQIIAAPVTLVGTVASLGQREKTAGRLLAEAFLGGTVGGTVTLVVTGVIAALLTLDVRRARTGA